LPTADEPEVGYDVGDFETAAGPAVGFALDGIAGASRRLPRERIGTEPDTAAEVPASPRKRTRGGLNKLSLIQNYARDYDLDWALIAAIARVESGFDQGARGPSGAVGVMQLLPSTAASRPLNMPNVADLETNIHAGVKYFRHLVDVYFADVSKDRFQMAIAAYKAGPARLVRYRQKARQEGLDPNRWHGHVEAIAVSELGADVANYVDSILRHYTHYRRQAPKI
jgi:membrane-bound lytic murein transglycosylase MltF